MVQYAPSKYLPQLSSSPLTPQEEYKQDLLERMIDLLEQKPAAVFSHTQQIKRIVDDALHQLFEKRKSDKEYEQRKEYLEILSTMLREEYTTFRTWQREGILRIIYFIAKGEQTKGLFKIPSSAGKTYFMAKIIKTLLQKNDQKHIVLVPFSHLKIWNTEEYRNVGIEEKDIAIIENTDDKNLGSFVRRKITKNDRKIMVLTYQGLNALKRNNRELFNILIKQIGWFWYDEAHRALGNETQDTLHGYEEEEFVEEEIPLYEQDHREEKKYHFALTASPVLLNKSVMDHYPIIMWRTLSESAKAGEITLPRYEPIVEKAYIHLKHGEEGIYGQMTPTEEQIESWSEEDDRFVDEHGRPIYKVLLDGAQAIREREGEIYPYMVYCESVKEAEKIRKYIEKELGAHAVRVTGASADNTVGKGSDPNEIRRKIENMQKDDRRFIDYIITVDMVGEGWNVPTIRGGIVIDPNHSPRIKIQRFGRVTRNAEGKKEENTVWIEPKSRFISPPTRTQCVYQGGIYQKGENKKKQIEEFANSYQEQCNQGELGEEYMMKYNLETKNIPNPVDIFIEHMLDPEMYAGFWQCLGITIKGKTLDLGSLKDPQRLIGQEAYLFLGSTASPFYGNLAKALGKEELNKKKNGKSTTVIQNRSNAGKVIEYLIEEINKEGVPEEEKWKAVHIPLERLELPIITPQDAIATWKEILQDKQKQEILGIKINGKQIDVLTLKEPSFGLKGDDTRSILGATGKTFYGRLAKALGKEDLNQIKKRKRVGVIKNTDAIMKLIEYLTEIINKEGTPDEEKREVINLPQEKSKLQITTIEEAIFVWKEILEDKKKQEILGIKIYGKTLDLSDLKSLKSLEGEYIRGELGCAGSTLYGNLAKAVEKENLNLKRENGRYLTTIQNGGKVVKLIEYLTEIINKEGTPDEEKRQIINIPEYNQEMTKSDAIMKWKGIVEDEKKSSILGIKVDKKTLDLFGLKDPQGIMGKKINDLLGCSGVVFYGNLAKAIEREELNQKQQGKPTPTIQNRGTAGKLIEQLVQLLNLEIEIEGEKWKVIHIPQERKEMIKEEALAKWKEILEDKKQQEILGIIIQGTKIDLSGLKTPKIIKGEMLKNFGGYSGSTLYGNLAKAVGKGELNKEQNGKNICIIQNRGTAGKLIEYLAQLINEEIADEEKKRIVINVPQERQELSREEATEKRKEILKDKKCQEILGIKMDGKVINLEGLKDPHSLKEDSIKTILGFTGPTFYGNLAKAVGKEEFNIQREGRYTTTIQNKGTAGKVIEYLVEIINKEIPEEKRQIIHTPQERQEMTQVEAITKWKEILNNQNYQELLGIKVKDNTIDLRCIKNPDRIKREEIKPLLGYSAAALYGNMARALERDDLNKKEKGERIIPVIQNTGKAVELIIHIIELINNKVKQEEEKWQIMK